jgi:hypothetical protein
VAHAIIFGGLWLAIALTMPDTTPMLVRVGAGTSMVLSYLLTWYVPIWLKHRHIRSQNRLLDRCRMLLILGSRAHGEGDEPTAQDALDRIRRLEQLWRFGNALPFRVALAIWAVGWSFAVCVGIRFAGLMMTHYGWTGRFIASENMMSELWIAVAISLFAIIQALTSYFESWVNPWVIENCGDRLWQLMFGPRAVLIIPETGVEVPNFDRMSPREVFGLPPTFTRRDLDRARRHLVQLLHPDRWQQASFRERHLREEALKRVNAAYDSLRQEIG